MSLWRLHSFPRLARALAATLFVCLVQQSWAVAGMVACHHQRDAVVSSAAAVDSSTAEAVDEAAGSAHGTAAACASHPGSDAGSSDPSSPADAAMDQEAHGCAACFAGASVTLLMPAMELPVVATPRFVLPRAQSPRGAPAPLERPPKLSRND